jgi:hypothetical protein
MTTELDHHHTCPAPGCGAVRLCSVMYCRGQVRRHCWPCSREGGMGCGLVSVPKLSARLGEAAKLG